MEKKLGFKDFVIVVLAVLVMAFCMIQISSAFQVKTTEQYQTFKGTVVSVDKNHNVQVLLEDYTGWYLENTQFLEVNDAVILVVDTKGTSDIGDDTIVDIEKTPIPVQVGDVHTEAVK